MLSFILKEARNDNNKQAVRDLTGFWSIIIPELIDVQKACEKVERHRLNRGRLSTSSAVSSPRSPKFQPTCKIPAPRSVNAANKKATPSRSTPGLRKFLASKRSQQAQILGEHNFWQHFIYSALNTCIYAKIKLEIIRWQIKFVRVCLEFVRRLLVNYLHQLAEDLKRT